MSNTDHTSDGPLDIAAERARLARAEAEHAALKGAVVRGELVPRERAHLMVAAYIERVRGELLAQIDAMAPRLIGATEAEFEAVFMEAVLEALKELPPDNGPIAA